MKKTLLNTLLAGCAVMAFVGSAGAGGFGRGTADTDIIYEDGNVNMRMGATIVSPSRKFTKNPVPGLVGTDYAETYAVPSAAIKMNVMNNVRCALTLVQNNGGDVRYAVPNRSGKLSESFDTMEYGTTCGVKFEVGKGNLWVLGGGFMEQFDYDRQNDFSAFGLPTAELSLNGKDFGYRAGIAYEIPDIALRAQLMYRSGTSYGADGTLNAPAGVLCQAVPTAAFCAGLPGNAATKYPVPSIGEGNLPQSVELKLQSGVAPGWLAFGSVKWTDWSVLESLDVYSKPGHVPISKDLYFWKDGWTITGGVGHAFTDRVSGLVSLTWDQGVGTGYDLSSDTWTLAIGGSAKDVLGGELRGGVGISYLTSSEETKYGALNQAVDNGWAYAFNVGYGVKW